MPIRRRSPIRQVVVKIKRPPVPKKLEALILSEPKLAKKYLKLKRQPGFRLNVWSTDIGFQANVRVEEDGNRWAVHVDRNLFRAIEGAVDSKMRVLRL